LVDIAAGKRPQIEGNFMEKRVLTGSRPSGSPHLGNYFGALKPAIELGKKFELFFFLADLHALNEGPDKNKMYEDSCDLVATVLACGLDVSRNHLFAQSAVPQVAELCWMLGCIAPFGMMQRGVAFKDAQARHVEVNMGIFNYPLLMAADILLFDAELVPVGKDQRQHLEMARDFGQRFNAKYGEIFTIPEALISEDVGLVPGTDGEKMSKSRGNVVSIFASDKVWKKQISTIVTSSEGLADPKNPDTCNVFFLYRLMATPEEIAVMADKYRAGGFGFGHAKIELLNKMIEVFGPMREKYLDLMTHKDDLRSLVQQGSVAVRETAVKKLDMLQQAMGLLGRPH
jgi:tryptophanyl-tRNA synthetase